MSRTEKNLPRMECDVEQSHGRRYQLVISIHTPRAGCDNAATTAGAVYSLFQSAHPAWGATYRHYEPIYQDRISIHAPRMGCDQCDAGNQLRFHNFNPRTPRGVRLNSGLLLSR